MMIVLMATLAGFRVPPQTTIQTVAKMPLPKITTMTTMASMTFLTPAKQV